MHKLVISCKPCESLFGAAGTGIISNDNRGFCGLNRRDKCTVRSDMSGKHGPSPRSLRARGVLVVDDDPQARRALVLGLEPLNVAVTTAVSADEAMIRLAEGFYAPVHPGLEVVLAVDNPAPVMFLVDAVFPDCTVSKVIGFA